MRRFSRTQAYVISLALVLLAVAGLWWASSLTGPFQSAVSSVASAMLSIGALSLVYEVWMRESIHQELIDLVGVERSTARSRLSSVLPYDEYSWTDVLGRAKNVKVLLSNPDPWLVSHFPALVEAAGKRETKIQILLPSETGRAKEMAEYHGVSEANFLVMVSRAAAVAEETWKSRDNLAKGSTLELSSYECFCASTVVETETELLLICYSPAGNAGQGLNNGLVLAFDRSFGAYPGNFLSKHLEYIAKSAKPMYVNKRGGR